MIGLGQMALDSAPFFGGALLAVAAGQFKGPDYRGLIAQDMDLLERLSPEDTTRRAELQRTIEARIDDLVDAADRSRAMRRAALSYQGNWRDGVLVLCALLFTIVWWNVNHNRTNWAPMFVLLILVCIVTTVYACRGVLRTGRAALRRRRGEQPTTD